MENLTTAPSSSAILTAVGQMPPAEMERLVEQLIALRARRVAPHLTAGESVLLASINQGLADDERSRLRALSERRDEAVLNAEEWRELAALTDRLEVLHADRLGALVELARLRGVTLDEVMAQLGIRFPWKPSRKRSRWPEATTTTAATMSERSSIHG